VFVILLEGVTVCVGYLALWSNGFMHILNADGCHFTFHVLFVWCLQCLRLLLCVLLGWNGEIGLTVFSKVKSLKPAIPYEGLSNTIESTFRIA